MKKNYHLCVDLTTRLQHDAMPELWDYYKGKLRMVDLDEFEFVETLTDKPTKRNPKVFDGKYGSITMWEDGTFHLNLKRVDITEGFNADSYCIALANELRQAVNGLVEE